MKKIYLLQCCFLFAGTQVLASEDDPVANRFYAEYPNASKRLITGYRRFEAKGFLDQDQNPRLPRQERAISLYVQDDLSKVELLNYRLDDQGKSSPPFSFVYALNADSAFELTRDFSKATSYKINKFERKGPTDKFTITNPTYNSFNRLGGVFASAPYKSPLIEPTLILNRDFFKITSAESDRDQDEEIVRIWFTNVDHSRGAVGGAVEFLPNRCWAIQQLDYQTIGALADPGHTAVTIDARLLVRYSGDRNGIPLAKYVYYDDGYQKSWVSFNHVELAHDHPASFFGVTQYGLPDLARPPADPTRSDLSYWLVAIATILLVIAVTIRRHGQVSRLRES